MSEIVKELMSIGTMGSLFLAFLIVSLAILGTMVKANMESNSRAIAANNLAMLDNLKLKDKRIEMLESEMKDINNYIKHELQGIINENLRVMQKVLIRLNN